MSVLNPWNDHMNTPTGHTYNHHDPCKACCCSRRIRHHPNLFSVAHILLIVPSLFVLPFHIPSLPSHFSTHRKINSWLHAETKSSSSELESHLQATLSQPKIDPFHSQHDDDSTLRKRKKKDPQKRDKNPSENELNVLTEVRPLMDEYENDPILFPSIESNSSTTFNRMDNNYNNNNNKNVLFWGAFERLFPEPVWDDATILRDLYEVTDRDNKQKKVIGVKDQLLLTATTTTTATTASSSSTSINTNTNKNNNFMRSLSRAFRDSSNTAGNNKSYNNPTNKVASTNNTFSSISKTAATSTLSELSTKDKRSILNRDKMKTKNRSIIPGMNTEEDNDDVTVKVDRALTRMVEERVYGYRRALNGDYVYETSLMGDGAVKFRDGKRLGYPLQINIDLLNYHAKREMKHGRLKEAEVLYEKAIALDPKDGRAYLGLSKIAERRRDFAHAKECLRLGIARSVSFLDGGKTPPLDTMDTKGSDTILRSSAANPTIHIPDHGANPFLLQALGTLEEQLGHLTEAEALYIEATKSRPSHAAAWVALGELRSKKLRQGPNAGRVCFQSAERELQLAGLPQSTYVYTAWASLEYKAGDVRKARELFQSALEIDPKCSSAWLQLGVLEANKENWAKAKECFETVLKFDQRNSRILQAYAIMESKQPNGDSREVIELFERALAMNPRDGGVYQAYALYVAKLGDLIGARKILRRGTEMDKRHAPLWLAWAVLESRNGSAAVARDIFQQGIWACAQSSGGQSGGRHCARLWQAWGVLEAQENDPVAARRCFNRALDADSRNVAAVTAWTLMEQELGNFKDARLIFERALKQFSSPSDEKMSLWRAYEVMETKAGNGNAAQQVYQRSIKDAILRNDYLVREGASISSATQHNHPDINKMTEVEVVTWKSRTDSGFGGNEVWMADDGSILGKVPSSAMKKKYK